MFDYIEKLRKSPEAKKRRFVAGAAASVTAIVVILWIVSLVIQIRGGALKLMPDGEAGQEFSGKIEAIKESWAGFMGDFNRAFESASDAVVPEPPATSTEEESFDTL